MESESSSTVNIQKLADEFRQSGVISIGSSSWKKEFSQTCINVCKWMSCRHGVYQYRNMHQALLSEDTQTIESMGQLYFGGWAKMSDSDKWLKIKPSEYLDFLLSDYSGLDDKTVIELDEMCKSFFRLITSGKGTTRSYDESGSS